MTPEQLTEIEARQRTARDAMTEDWQDNNAVTDAISSSMYDVPALLAEVRRLRRKHDRRCLSLTESENNVYCDCRTLAMIDGAALANEALTAERDHLRMLVDAALALHRPEKRYHDGSAEWSTDDPSEIAEEHDYPLDEVPYFEVCAHCGEIEMSQSDHASYLESMWPCATVRALAPVADPDPHTTSDKEQQ
jgi:hypothetical protein